MSRVRRLSVRGIRNFGDESEESTIRFSRPLTLILGPNGVGKTTIIEALKFATTGDFPPGSSNGKAFIHDPIMSASPSTRGVVKVETLDSDGNVFMISRTIELTRTATSIKFKTLDNTLTRVDKVTKKKTSLTQRCADIDNELAQIMGVSKAVLNNVVFCHQEDINWPLDEGKKLKERFDEIFNNTRYNKAVENINKECKDLHKDLRALKTEKTALKMIVDEVEDKEGKLEDLKKRLEISKMKIQEIEGKLLPLNQRVQELQKMDSEYKNLVTEREKKEMEYNLSKRETERLSANIENIFIGPLEELNARIHSYDNDLKTKQNEILQTEEKLRNLAIEEDKVAKLLAEQRIVIGTLRQKEEDYKNKLAQHNKLLSIALDTSTVIDENISDIEIVALTRRLEEKVQDFEREVEGHRLKMDEEEKRLQEEVDELRSEKSKYESEMSLRDKEVYDIRKEVSNVQTEITQTGIAANKLNSVESRLEEANKKIDELSKTLDVNVVKSEIAAKTEKKSEIEAKLNTIDTELMSLHAQSTLQAELDLYKQTVSRKQKEVEDLRKQHEDNLKMLLEVDSLPESKLKHQLDVVQEGLVSKINNLTTKIRKEQHELTTLETTMHHKQQEYQAKIAELESDKSKVLTVCNYKDFDEALVMQSIKVKDLQDKKGMYSYKDVAYKEYLEQLKKQDPCCPLCHQGFQEKEKVTLLIKEIENDMKNYPKYLQESEKELKKQQMKYDTMLQLKPTVEKIIQLEEVELKKLRTNLKRLKECVYQSQENLRTLDKLKEDPEKKLALCKNINSDIMLLDQSMEEIQKLNEKIDTLETKMCAAGVTSTRTIQQVQEEQNILKAALKKTTAEIEDLQQQIGLHNDKMQHLRDTRNVLYEEQLKIRSDMQKLKQLRDKQSELYEREISLGELLKSVKEKFETADTKLNVAVRQLENTKKENRKRQEDDRQSVAAERRRLSDLHTLQSEIDSYVHGNIAGKLQSTESNIQNYERLIQKFIQEKSNYEKTMNKLKEDVSRQEVSKRETLDNIALLKNKEVTEKLEQECAQIKHRLKAMNYNKIMEEWRQLQRKEEILLREKNVAKGNQEELERSVGQYTKDLTKEVYRSARDKYKHKFIELTVQEAVIADLHAYNKVLDTAMIECHKERMATINKVIHKLWRGIYSGTDTTSISIRTEATQGFGEAKRQYDYKLMQTKHGREIEMRGRCSAGQKVLASIIIRLALAETLCKDCGILALDEPTTNLDEENTKNLADALAAIVKIRSQYQKNFQLIIITHDEKFLLKLARLNDNKGFYELYRKENGFTSIKYCDVADRNSHLEGALKEELESSADELEEENDNAYTKQSKAATELANKKRAKGSHSDDEQQDSRPSKKRYVFKMN